MATCPTCTNSRLKHVLLADNLPAYVCPTCDGLLVSLVAFRRWRDVYGQGEPPHATGDTPEPVDDSDAAINCSRCGGIMTKYRFAASLPNHIDYCAHCEDIWLDSGEWALVEQLAGSRQLSSILTEPWQHRIQAESRAAMETQRLRAVLGDDYDRTMDFKTWLDAHEQRDRILALLTR